MKKKARKILAIILIPILLFSNTSFSVNEHICGGEMVSMSFFGKAHDCDMGMEMDDCKYEMSSSSTISRINCCLDESEFIQGSISIENKEDDFVNVSNYSLTLFLFSRNQWLHINEEAFKQFKSYKPPQIIRDISVLFEVFRI